MDIYIGSLYTSSSSEDENTGTMLSSLRFDHFEAAPADEGSGTNQPRLCANVDIEHSTRRRCTTDCCP